MIIYRYMIYTSSRSLYPPFGSTGDAPNPSFLVSFKIWSRTCGWFVGDLFVGEELDPRVDELFIGCLIKLLICSSTLGFMLVDLLLDVDVDVCCLGWSNKCVDWMLIVGCLLDVDVDCWLHPLNRQCHGELLLDVDELVIVDVELLLDIAMVLWSLLMLIK